MRTTRTNHLSRRTQRRIAWSCLSTWIMVLFGASCAWSQQPPIHYFHRADMAPGAVGFGQLQRGGPLPGYFQPVRITAPQGCRIALAAAGTFAPADQAPVTVGLLVGRVYRLKVSNIPAYEGLEIFPSIEVINRLYPPPGQEVRFPVPVELTRAELELALRGQFVTRVIYLEDPRRALPHRSDPKQQRYFDVGPNQEPLRVADELGRPMAIVRIGSRVPAVNATTGRFLFDSPPWLQIPAVAPSRQPGNEPTTIVQRARRTPTANAQPVSSQQQLTRGNAR